jgi:DNA-binding transcriptional LysR family regulator
MKPEFEVAEHLASGALIRVAINTPPVPTQLACLAPSRKYRDPKLQAFADYMASICRDAIQRKQD